MATNSEEIRIGGKSYNLGECVPPKIAGILLGGSDRPITRRTLYNWRQLARGPKYIQIGRCVRYIVGDLIEFRQSIMRGNGGHNGRN